MTIPAEVAESVVATTVSPTGDTFVYATESRV